MKKLIYYSKNVGYNLLPSFYFKQKFQRLMKAKQQFDAKEIEHRLNYYVKLDTVQPIPEQAVAINNFKFQKPSTYYFDLKEYLHYFKPETRFAFCFGDDTHVNDYATLFKARPIASPNEQSVLFKLNKLRHFEWVNDTVAFEDKQDALIWRGDAHQPIRQLLLQNYQDKPRFNVGDVSNREAHEQWRKPFAGKEEQLQYKFIFCPEGRDVATSLKWIFSSNSLCVMPKPTNETWFMEGTLQQGVHYVEVKNDLSDLEEKMDYYSQHLAEAKEIIHNAQQHVKQFQNPVLEDVLSILVLKRYADMTNQPDSFRFAL